MTFDSLVSLDSQNGEASLFEVNIRYVGGLLAAYYLTGEEVRLVGSPASFIPGVCVCVCVSERVITVTFQLFLYC